MEENKEEVWVEMFEFPNYEISNLGNIRNSKNERQIKVRQDGKEYRMASLFYNKRKYNKRVGRYVWMSFNNQFCSATIDHINGDAGDDSLGNLRCISMEDNRAARRKYKKTNKYNLTKRDKGYIHYAITNKLETTWTIMKKYGVPLNYIGTTMKRGSWEKYLPYYEL
jgi:hypothetical protein